MSKNREQTLNHVAIVMDGNGRWAQQRGLERIEGHFSGIEAAKNIIEAAMEQKIRVLSLFAFSSENWARPADEVNALMALLLESLTTEVLKLHQHDVQLQFIGDIAKFNMPLQEAIAEAESLTKNNAALRLVIALNYGGRWDIAQAVKKIIEQDCDGSLMNDESIEQKLGTHLTTNSMLDLDLLIRTSGEKRLSNFFLWQAAYAELYFTDVLWPDFGKEEFKKAVDDYHSRERRFGR